MGIGVDIEDSSRFKELWERDHPFFRRFFTEAELESAVRSNDVISWLAGRFCSKEAVSKAIMEMGDPSPDYRSIEVLSKANGCPWARVVGSEDKYLINISISHTDHTIIAFAIVRGQKIGSARSTIEEIEES
jgi:phosphopantetheine--protein transferase-like protein